jgi:hypothetical protein
MLYAARGEIQGQVTGRVTGIGEKAQPRMALPPMNGSLSIK